MARTITRPLHTACRRVAHAATLTVAVAALGSASAHAASSQATLTITKNDPLSSFVQVRVKGQFATSTVNEAKALAAQKRLRVAMSGDDSVYDDFLGVLNPEPDFKPNPTTAAVQFDSTFSVFCGKLNEDDYVGNRRDEVYAEVGMADKLTGIASVWLKTNNVSTFDFSFFEGGYCDND